MQAVVVSRFVLPCASSRAVAVRKTALPMLHGRRETTGQGAKIRVTLDVDRVRFESDECYCGRDLMSIVFAVQNERKSFVEWARSASECAGTWLRSELCAVCSRRCCQDERVYVNVGMGDRFRRLPAATALRDRCRPPDGGRQTQHVPPSALSN